MSDDEVEACRKYYDLPDLPARTVVSLCKDSTFLAFYRFNKRVTNFGRVIKKALLPFGRNEK
jgi:hypothetical protein